MWHYLPAFIASLLLYDERPYLVLLYNPSPNLWGRWPNISGSTWSSPDPYFSQIQWHVSLAFMLSFLLNDVEERSSWVGYPTHQIPMTFWIRRDPAKQFRPNIACSLAWWHMPQTIPTWFLIDDMKEKTVYKSLLIYFKFSSQTIQSHHIYSNQQHSSNFQQPRAISKSHFPRQLTQTHLNSPPTPPLSSRNFITLSQLHPSIHPLTHSLTQICPHQSPLNASV